jgi:hypothetical protein
MLCHVIVAMRRADLSEATVAIEPTEAQARQTARKVAAAMRQTFVRCRVRQVSLTPSEVEAICFEWGREDALAGEPLRKIDFPKPYATAYRHGYRVGKRLTSRGGNA